MGLNKKIVHIVVVALCCIGVVVGLLWPRAYLSPSLFGGPLALVEPSTLTVLFGGDMMFDRSLRAYAREYGEDYLLECVEPVLREADAVVANLEGPITDNPSRSEGSVVGSADNFIFTFAPSIANLLKKYHFSAVNLGNNHIENFGRAGVESTMSYLTAAGVGYFGDPIRQTTATITRGSVTIELINYNEFDGMANSAETTVRQIEAARLQGHLPVVYTHWGPEYEQVAANYMRALAYQFVDAGAAIVIGSHPHVVADTEVYQGAPIYYSLGNFVFDQYFTAEVSSGLLIKVSFTKEGVESIEEISIKLTRDRRVCPVQNS